MSKTEDMRGMKIADLSVKSRIEQAWNGYHEEGGREKKKLSNIIKITKKLYALAWDWYKELSDEEKK